MPTRSFSWWPIARTILLSASVGTASGIIASVLTSQSLERYADFLLDRYRAPSVSTEKPSPVPGTYEEALTRVRSSAEASMAMFVPLSDDTSLPASMVDASDAVAYGMVISSDGWIVTTQLSPDNLPSTDVWVDGMRYQVVQVIDDTLSDLRLVKVEGTGLTAVGFGSSNIMENGEMVFGLSPELGIALTYLEESDLTTLSGPQPAEIFATAWRIGDELGASLPLVNASGNLVGFTLENRLALPLHHGLGFLQRAMQGSDAGHAGLGASVIDLSRALNVESALRQGVSSGALILSSSSSERALVRGAAGAEAGLAVRDIILTVNGEAITSEQTLAELLATYEEGQTARLGILRSGESVSVTVTFGDAADLVY
ncbi:MAG: S1C family serine protease [Candidatus Uhrbacteria bacterium]|nr:S1C family serine protease [Candidatus Uhrbacteria bacterium]